MEQHNKQPIPLLARLIFSSRWLQLPLYLGLIVAQVVYVYHFLIELWHLVGGTASHQLDETGIMLIVLALSDVVMISNLLIIIFLLSAVAIAWCDRLISQPPHGKPH